MQAVRADKQAEQLDASSLQLIADISRCDFPGQLSWYLLSPQRTEYSGDGSTGRWLLPQQGLAIDLLLL